MSSNDRLRPEQRAVIDWLKSVRNDGGVESYPGGFDRFRQDLMQKLHTLSVRVPGQTPDAVTLLYSGPLGDQLRGGWEVAESIGARSKGQVVTIGQTPIGELQNHPNFDEALRFVFGGEKKHLYEELVNGVHEPGRAHVQGIWDRASARLAGEAQGDVRTLTPSAADHKVFAREELQALLNNPKVTHINSVPIEVFRDIHINTPGSESQKLSRVNQAVSASSYEITRDMRWREVPGAARGPERFEVDPGRTFEGTPHQSPVRLAPQQATFDMSKGDPSMTPEQLRHIHVAQVELHAETKKLGSHHASSAAQTLQRRTSADRAPEHTNTGLRNPSLLKGLGAAGTAYGLYQGYGDVQNAVDTARSTREQHIRGAEAAVDLGTRATVSGGAAVVGGVAGGAAGTAVAPGAGTTVGAIVGGTAAAVGAEHAYENSRLQQFSRWAGRQAGAISYEFFSDEGKLGRQVESLRQELQQTQDEGARTSLQAKLQQAGEAFKTEVDRNNAYFQGREGIEKAWPEMSRRFPKLDKDDLLDAYERRHQTQVAGQPSGKPYPHGNERAVRGAFSDAVHEQHPRGLPHVPVEDHRTLSPAQLAERHQQYAGEVVQGRRMVEALEANKDSHNNVDQGWPRELAQKRQAARVEEGRNELWRDTGHLSAIRNAYRERGLQLPELPAELRPKPPAHAPQGAQGTQSTAFGGRTSIAHEAPPARLGPVSQQLLQDSEREVAQVAQRHGLAWDQGMRNTSAAVAATAREAGLSQVNLLRANGGQIHLAHYDGVQVRDAWVDAKAAANTPQEHSLQRLQVVDRRLDGTERAGADLEASKPHLVQAHEGLQRRAEASPVLA